MEQAYSLPSYQDSSQHRLQEVGIRRTPYYSGRNFQQEGAGGSGASSQDVSTDQIHLASMEGVSSSQIKSLALQFGVDYRDNGGRTPLMYAVLGNQPKMCETLLKLKANVNARDLSGLTPLLWATYQAKPNPLRILLK